MAQIPYKLHAYMPWHMQPRQIWWQKIASHDAGIGKSRCPMPVTAGSAVQRQKTAKTGLRISRRFTLHVLPENNRIADVTALLAFRQQQRQWSGKAHFALYTTGKAAANYPP